MKLTINDQTYDVQADDDTPLLWVIRDDLGMTGTKYGCGLAQCGACSVLIDGQVMRSCVTPVGSVAGKSITTSINAHTTVWRCHFFRSFFENRLEKSKSSG